MRFTNAATSLYQAAISYGIASGQQALPFVIVAGPRSGSTLVQTLLHSHPRAVCMHELLLRSGGTPRFYRYNLGRRNRLMQMRKQNMGAFLNKVLCDPQPPWVEAVGFKALYVQPRDEEARRATWRRLGQISNLRVIWLRRNPVRRVISFAIARETGKWVGKKTKETIRLDPEYILHRLRFEEQEAEAAWKRIQGSEIMEVHFESLTESPDAVLTEIQDFLGLPIRPLHSSLTSQNPRMLREMITNFSDIKGALSGTKWEEPLIDAMNRSPQEL